MATGIIYRSLKSKYPGDITKNAGLITSEIDSNFQILEGNQIKKLSVNDNLLSISLFNGDCFSVNLSNTGGGGLLPDNITIKKDEANRIFVPIDDTTIKVIDGKLTAPLSFNIEIYNSLSDITNPNSKTIYLIPKTGTSGDVYNEYIYTNNQFEQIGTTQIDLSNYYTKGETDTLLSGKANSSHTHTKSQITDFAHTHTKSDITDFPTIGTGTLNIKVNNVSQGTFSANATSNTNVNISVPTVNNSTINIKNEDNQTFGSFTTNESSFKDVVITDFDGIKAGLVPVDNSNNTSSERYLCNDGTWKEIQGGGTEYAVYVENEILQIPATSTTVNITDETLNLI